MTNKKKKRKINKTNLAAIIVASLALIAIICVLIGIIFLMILLQDKPKLNLSDFTLQESSQILDENDELVYELGTTIRRNVEYDDLPTCVIDAFVAIEDSRFFVHNGFDVPRFTKAFIDNIRTLSFGQGGSTFTMQLIKNTYFVDDDAGQGATKSIKRKVQEISLALELENTMSKKEIFVNYLNKLYFGGTYSNIRGIQKASEYYFGKEVSELNLEEAAMLAGVINAPYAYNPYLNLEKAQQRRDQVLYQMLYHGYITNDEYRLALSTKVENFLKDSYGDNKGEGKGEKYQAYVDAVVDEVYELTGLDPYTTPMIIHTYMNKGVQQTMDKIQENYYSDIFEFPDDEFEIASICIDNQTGGVIGVLGGRNYADGGALLLNHATAQKKQPGSSIKPVLDYAQAFETLGWSTSHVLTDKPLNYIGTGYIISNSDNKYNGDMTLKDAIGNSKNTPAIQTIRQVIDEKGNKYLVDYLNDIGIKCDYQNFNEQYGIGGSSLEVSCLDIAGAYNALISSGQYIKPHFIKTIEFLNEKAPIEPQYTKKQVISEQASYLMCDILANNVSDSYPFYSVLKDERYDVYAKTGTTNWGTEGEAYGIRNGSIKDGWIVAGTSSFTTATWIGYEKAVKGKPSYITSAVYNTNIKGKIANLIIDSAVNKYGIPKKITRPSGISEITHIVSTFPYAKPLDGMDEKYITTGLIKSDSKYASVISPKQVQLEPIKKDGSDCTINGTILSLEWPTYPDESQLKIAPEEKDISLKNSNGEIILQASGARLFDYTWAYGAVKYKADIYVNETKVDTYTSDDNEAKVDISKYVQTGDNIKVYLYYGYEKLDSINDYVLCQLKITDEVSLNIPDGSLDIIRSYFQNLGCNVEVEAKEDKSHNDGEVYRIVGKTNGIIPETEEFLPGHQYETTRSKIANITIYYYTTSASSFTLTCSPSSSVNKNQEVIIYADNAPGLINIWTVDGKIQLESSNTLTTSFSDSGTHVIKCTSGLMSQEIVITVK